MKNKINNFSNGKFDYELPLICLSEDKIRITVEAGSVYEGSFTISNSEKTSIRGILYSSDRLLTIDNYAFSGEESKLHYKFDAAYLKIGDTIHEKIYIVSDCGEQILPFTFQIEAPYYMSSLGKIKDLFQFTNLARTDWSEAKKVFYSGRFEDIFLYNEEKYRVLYENLIKDTEGDLALEEFLIAIHKKSPIHLSVDRIKLEYQVLEESFLDSLILSKDNWGYCEVKISTDAAFLQMEQKIDENFFLGHSQQISFVIHPHNMRYGINYGRIRIKNVHQTINVDVVCRHYKDGVRKTSDFKIKQRVEALLMKNYLGLRLDKIKLSKYLNESKSLLDNLPKNEENSILELYRTHMYIISGKRQKAKEQLNRFAKYEAVLSEHSCLEYCAYLYLNALYYNNTETIQKAAKIIKNYYEKTDFDWKFLWFLFFTDKRYENKINLKLEDIRKQFEAGCHSPILYYEAVCVFQEEPSLLHELNEFEIQVLNFGIKNWNLTKDLVQQYTYLANKKKKFNPVIFQGLVKLYRVYHTNEILSAICSILIKGLKRSQKYFEWYRLGVQAQLRITELYEYYMNTIDEKTEELLPQSVLRYFVYNSSLNERKLAFLYANIIKNKHQNEGIYRSYYKRMEAFAGKQLEAHRVSRDLAVLYREYMEKENPDTKYSNHLPYVIYRQELECKNPNIVSVAVAHKELETEELQTIYEGRVQIDIYTKNAVIFLIDARGNRYAASEKYILHPLMAAKYYETQCIDYSNNYRLLLHLYDRYQSYRIENEQVVSQRKKILSIEGLKDKYYYECLQVLIEYYYDKYCSELTEYYLRFIDLHRIRQTDRIKLIGYMIQCSMYYRAVEELKTFGYEEMGKDCLAKLCSGWLAVTKAEKKDEFMVCLCYNVFTKGKYNEAILKYLVEYYYGSTHEMYRLWKASSGFDLDIRCLEERLLVQMLFTESYVQNSFAVFNRYYKNEADKSLVRAYLNYYSYKYLIHGCIVNDKIFTIIRKKLNYEENDIYLLAWLKFTAKASELPENEITFIEFQIQRLLKKSIILPFFMEFEKWMKLPDSISNKSYVEYITNPNKQVYIYYRLSKEYGTEEFVTERLPNIFMGLHVRGFVLFYHEELQYYITEECGGKVMVTESATLHHDRETSEEETNYNLINLMLMAKEMKDEKTFLELMDHYARKKCMIKKCFVPVE